MANRRRSSKRRSARGRPTIKQELAAIKQRNAAILRGEKKAAAAARKLAKQLGGFGGGSFGPAGADLGGTGSFGWS